MLFGESPNFFSYSYCHFILDIVLILLVEITFSANSGSEKVNSIQYPIYSLFKVSEIGLSSSYQVL